MKRLALMLAVAGLCAAAGACDGSRGLTEPAGRVQNVGTTGSGLQDGMEGDGAATTQDNGGTSGSGHREGTAPGGATTQGSGTGLPDEVILENGGTMGSGH